MPRFQITVSPATPGDQPLIESATIVFYASSWVSAGKWGDQFRKTLCMDGPSWTSTIVLAADVAPRQSQEEVAA